MNLTLKEYKQQLEACPGDALTKVKNLISDHLRAWRVEDEGLLIDILDDRNIAATDILEMMEGMLTGEPEQQTFKQAVMAVRLYLEKERLRQISSEDLSWEISTEDAEETSEVRLRLAV